MITIDASKNNKYEEIPFMLHHLYFTEPHRVSYACNKWVNNKAWMPVRQQFIYLTKAGKSKQSGNTIALFNNYNVDTSFAKKHFTTTEKEKFSELIKIGLERDRIHKEHVSAKNKGVRKP